MACKTCGSKTGIPSVALPLASNPVDTCSKCSQPSSACGCEAYCEEDHVQTTIYKRYGFSLRVKTAFVWPACNETVTLTVEGVDRLSPGSVIWNPNAGRLHVQSFDFAAQQIVALNECEVCNQYVGGEGLPECTEFVVGPPECNTGSEPIPGIPYLAADFISPAEGDCQLASVTNITGLTLNDTISINGYEYRINDLPDANTIELCNDGDGAPGGTVIEWDVDEDGIPNIPVLVIASENPCLREGIVAGVLLACDGSDVTKPLVGSLDGQIPVWNDVTERFELKNLVAPFTSCTALTADLTTDSGDPGPYTIIIGSSAGMQAGTIIIIGNLFYTVNSVTDAVTIEATPFLTPVGTIVYPTGSSVCIFNSPTIQGIQNNQYNYVGRTTGAADVFDLTPSPAIPAYVAGQRFSAILHQSNTLVNASGSISGLASLLYKKRMGSAIYGVLPGDMADDAEADIMVDESTTYLMLMNPQFPHVIDRWGTDVAWSNTAAEKDMYDLLVLANTLGLYKGLKVKFQMEMFNNTGGGVNMTIRVRWGGVLIYAGTVWALPSGGLDRFITGEIIIKARNNSALQGSTVRISADVSAVGDTTGSPVKTATNELVDYEATYSAIAVDNTINNNFKVTAQMGTASVNAISRLKFAIAELV